jgi:type IV pilus assembly protein PilX
MRVSPPRSPHHQSGMTLIIALIFLVCLSLLGVWSVSNNSLQERMAGNTRNRDLALQAAEAALKEAELSLSTWRTGTFDGSNGLFTYDATRANDQAYWMNDANWTSYRTVSTDGLNQVAQAPRYVVEKMANTANPTPNMDGSISIDVENYRITARAVGGDPNAVVILQSKLQFTP